MARLVTWLANGGMPSRLVRDHASSSSALAFSPAETSRQPPGGYRNAKLLQTHHDFWKLYFGKANARLMAFGQPNLLAEVR